MISTALSYEPGAGGTWGIDVQGDGSTYSARRVHTKRISEETRFFIIKTSGFARTEVSAIVTWMLNPTISPPSIKCVPHISTAHPNHLASLDN